MSQEDAPVPDLQTDWMLGYSALEHPQNIAKLTRAELVERLNATQAQLNTTRQQLTNELAQRQALVQALVEIQKRESLSLLASGLAHNFNNLLTTILGNAELALLELAPDAAMRINIAPIIIAAQRATRLTRDMMMFAGTGNMLAQPLDLNETIASVIQLIGDSIARHVMLTSELAEHLPQIVGDANQIRHALTNLVNNAIEAIGTANGTIQVTTALLSIDEPMIVTAYHTHKLPAGYYVTLAVTDDGVGMDATTREKIFDPFFTTKFTGRGLGLAAVRGVVFAHHGALHVESHPGHGTTVQIIFPALNADSPFTLETASNEH